jgi:phage protein D
MTATRDPAYKVTIAGTVVDTTDEPRASTAVALDVRLGLGPAADGVAITIGRVGGPPPAQGDDLVVELGYAGDPLVRVLTGTVTGVEAGLETALITGHGAGAGLVRSRVDRTFLAKSAGAIVRALAQDAQVTVGRAEDGVTLPAYVIDGRRSLYAHVCDLADLSGFDAYVDPDGALVFERFAGGRTVHALEFAKHILALEGFQQAPRAGVVEAWGVGGGAGRGGEAWAWLVKDFGPTKGTEGQGTPKLLLERPAIRTAAVASAAARGLAAEVRRNALRGRLRLAGRPSIRLGDAVRVRDTPDSALNVSFQVRGIAHRLTKHSGFTTTLELRSTT